MLGCGRLNAPALSTLGIYLYFSCLKVGAGGGGRIDLASTLALKLFPRVGARVVGGGGRKNDKKQRPSLESTP